MALDRPSLRPEAIACAGAWLEGPTPPPRGYACLVTPLDGAGCAALAERALERATAAAEPGARGRLAARIEQRAHAAYLRGALHEARELLLRAVALEE